MNHILVIDDDKDLCTIVKRYMEKENYQVDLVHTGCQGILQAENTRYELIVLDVMLPEIDGFRVLSEIRKCSTVPVLMLTAKDSEMDKIHGLRGGADDYMTKPFSIPEFMARVESLIRRYTAFGQSNQQQAVIKGQSIMIDPNTRTVRIADRNIDLTGKEFDLLYFLASHKGMVFTKKQIYNQVWEEEYAFDDSNIMAFISKLRKKLEAVGNHREYIQTIRGIGYRFNQEA